jgi:hypothetical protein
MPETCAELEKQVDTIRLARIDFWAKNQAINRYKALEEEKRDAEKEVEDSRKFAEAKEAYNDVEERERVSEEMDRRAVEASARFDQKDRELAEAQRALDDALNAPLSGANPDRALEVRERQVEAAETRLARAEAAWERAWEQAMEAEQRAWNADVTARAARENWDDRNHGLSEADVSSTSDDDVSARVDAAQDRLDGATKDLADDTEGAVAREHADSLMTELMKALENYAAHGC